MKAEVIPHEAAVRLGFFLGIFALMATWEFFAARRERTVLRRERWPGNLGIIVIDTVLARVVAPAGAVGFALFAEARHMGLFNALLLPRWVAFFVALFVLDLAIYLQHRVFHGVPVLWM